MNAAGYAWLDALKSKIHAMFNALIDFFEWTPRTFPNGGSGSPGKCQSCKRRDRLVENLMVFWFSTTQSWMRLYLRVCRRCSGRRFRLAVEHRLRHNHGVSGKVYWNADSLDKRHSLCPGEVVVFRRENLEVEYRGSEALYSVKKK